LYLYITSIFYLLLVIVYIKIFSQKEMTSSYIILQIIQILIVAFIGILMFEEKLSLNKFLGIILGGLSIYFVNTNQKNI
jgi:hypothetical protein